MPLKCGLLERTQSETCTCQPVQREMRWSSCGMRLWHMHTRHCRSIKFDCQININDVSKRYSRFAGHSVAPPTGFPCSVGISKTVYRWSVYLYKLIARSIPWRFDSIVAGSITSYAYHLQTPSKVPRTLAQNTCRHTPVLAGKFFSCTRCCCAAVLRLFS